MSEGVQTAVVSPTRQETQGRGLDRGPASSAPVVEVERPALSPEAPCRPGGRSPGQALGAVGRSWSLSPGAGRCLRGGTAGFVLRPGLQHQVPRSSSASSRSCWSSCHLLVPSRDPVPHEGPPSEKGGTPGCHQEGRSPVPVCTLVCVCVTKSPLLGGRGPQKQDLVRCWGGRAGRGEDPRALSPWRTAAPCWGRPGRCHHEGLPWLRVSG